MDISKLPTGTRLMWDAPNVLGGRIVRPVTLGEKHPHRDWTEVKFFTEQPGTWRGPIEDALRTPTMQEFTTLKWPVVDTSSQVQSVTILARINPQLRKTFSR